MENVLEVINNLMTNVYDDITKLEQNAIKSGNFNDLSVTEMHTIDAVGVHETEQMGEIAKRLGITVGTLTVAINNLVKKKYVERFRNENDRRVVLVRLSNKGRTVYRMHEKFHYEVIKNAIKNLNDEEQQVLATALSKVHRYMENVTFENNRR